MHIEIEIRIGGSIKKNITWILIKGRLIEVINRIIGKIKNRIKRKSRTNIIVISEKFLRYYWKAITNDYWLKWRHI